MNPKQTVVSVEKWDAGGFRASVSVDGNVAYGYGDTPAAAYSELIARVYEENVDRMRALEKIRAAVFGAP